MGIKNHLLPVLIILGFITSASNVFAIYGDSDEAFGLDASVRNNVFATYNHKLDFTTLDDENRTDGLANMLLRVTAGGQPFDWLKYEFHGLSATTISGASANFGGLFGANMNNVAALRYRLFNGQYNLSSEQDVMSSLTLERSNVSFFLPFADVTVGRQAITFGKAYFWNPLDIFSPFNATQFDRDYKNGVDALKVDIPIGDDGGFTIVASATQQEGRQDKSTWESSAIVGRIDWTLAGWDVSLQGGKVYGGYQAGAATAGELYELPFRLEGAYFEPDRNDIFGRHASIVVGTGYRFENTLALELEYFYNRGAAAIPVEAARGRLAEDGTRLIRNELAQPETFCAENAQLIPEGIECTDFVSSIANDDTLITNLVEQQFSELSNDQARRLANLSYGQGEGRLLNVSEQLLGLSLSYELLPILTGSLGAIYSISDQSAILQPGLRLSISDEVDLLAGAIFSIGKRATGTPDLCQQSFGCPESEFGSYPHIFYMQSKLYF